MVVTAREDDIHDAWEDLADAEAEHDLAHAVRAWERISALQADLARDGAA